MLIKADTNGKKEKTAQLYHEKNKSIFGTNVELKEVVLANTKNPLSKHVNFNKYEAYMIINKLEEISKYVPLTQKIKSFSQIVSFIQENERIILRPIDFCINDPIYFLEAADDFIIITDNKNLNSNKKIKYCDSELKEILQVNKVSLDSYFLQKSIRYFKKGELPNDMRITMEKDTGVNWKFSSLEFIMGKNKILIEKVFDKSEGKYLKKVLKKSLPVGFKHDLLIDQINIICQKACNILQQNNPDLCEYEFDIAIDNGKKLWISDINIFNSFKSFKQIDFETYISSNHAPILYEVPNCN